MEIPSYLHNTAYGQRFFTAMQGVDLDGDAASASDAHQKRIYNKTRVLRTGASDNGFGSSSSSSASAAFGLRKASRSRYSSGPSTPSTLPIFRDDQRGEPIHDDDESRTSSLTASSSISKPINEAEALLPQQQAPPELPKRWVKNEEDKQFEISKDGTFVTYRSEGKASVQEARVVKSDNPISSLCGVWYYEVEIQTSPRDLMLSIGICTEAAHLKKMPGLEYHTWGYHSDDGKAVACQTPGNEYGPVFGCGDIIGCGIDFSSNTIFYTKNGIAIGTAFKEVGESSSFDPTEYYPCMGFKPSVRLKTNFGEEEFIYDINQYVQDKKLALIDSITKDDQVLPTIEGKTLTNKEVPELVQELISSYFSYLGYVDTAKAFQEEVKAERAARTGETATEDEKMEGDEEQGANSQDIEVLNRQRINRLINDGEIDRAFKYLKLFFPQVLEEKDSLVVFKLKCCKFIELIRATIPAESNQDVVMTDDGAEQGSSFNREAALSEAVEYGQALRDEYKEDTRPYIENRLKLIFSLVAYNDPREDESVSFLLDESERHILAEEVNSRILVSLGKAPIPPLQRVAQHTMGLIWELQNSGRLDTNLLNIQRDFF